MVSSYGSRNSLISLAVISLVFIITATVLDCGPFTTDHYRLIGHADEAEISSVANNILSGNGPVADCYWLLHGQGHYTDKLPRLEGYWSIYLAYTQAMFFYVFGASRTSVLLTASMFKSALAVLVGYSCWKLSRSKLVALTGLLFSLFSPQMLDRVDGLSDIQLTFFGFLTMVIIQKAMASRSIWIWFCIGAISGVAIGFKPTGLLFVGLVFVALFYEFCSERDPWRLGLKIMLSVVGVLVGLLPLFIHNYHASGSIIWPDFARIATGTKLVNSGLAGHNQAMFDPETPSMPGDLFKGSWFIRHIRLISIFSIEFLNGSGIHIIWLFPFVLMGLVVKLNQFLSRKVLASDCDRFFFLYFWLLLAAVLLGFVAHCESRYWNFLMPIEITLALYYVHRLSPKFIYCILAVGVIVDLASVAAIVKTTKDGSERAVKEKIYRVAYEQADKNLPQDSIVITSDPWEFSFHTRRKTVVVPYNSNPEVLRKIAARFSATHLAIINNDIRNPQLKKEITESSLDFLEKVYASKELVIWKFNLEDATGL
jgi:hypothetical protein